VGSDDDDLSVIVLYFTLYLYLEYGGMYVGPQFGMNPEPVRGSVAANIDYSLVSERWYFFLQLRIGPTNLLVVPRNNAIFPKLHTNRY